MLIVEAKRRNEIRKGGKRIYSSPRGTGRFLGFKRIGRLQEELVVYSKHRDDITLTSYPHRFLVE